MRNLKKVLSLVLALAMVLSICMVGAGAVNYDDFTDEESITKKQAVETLVSLDVIKGYNDGATFNPTGNVTRAEMATMICRILAGGDNMIVDATKPVPTYADIDGHWAESYIEYCTSLGIVSGKSPTSFDPDADVTAAEAAKMVMTTLGYNADIEQFKGIGWDINTMAKANTLQLLNNLQGEISSSVPATREQVAQLLFNALGAYTVQNYVGTTANTWIGSGAEAYHETLLESKFNAEKIVGVVVANEWADLYDEEPLAAGKTRVLVLGTDNMPTKQEYTVNLTTSLEQVGESIIVYRDTKSNRILFGNDQGTDMNVVNEFTAKGDITKGSDFENAIDKNTLTSDTQYFVNYGIGYETTSDYKIKYVVECVDTAAAQKLFDSNKELGVKDTAHEVNGKVYERSISKGSSFTSDDLFNIELIFDIADKIVGADEKEVYKDGEVYVGTQSTKDASDTMSWKEFKDEYLKTDLENTKNTQNQNGNYIKTIDYNKDGEIDFVLKTVYSVTNVKSVRDDKVDLYLDDVTDLVNAKNKVDSVYAYDELAKDDIVVYAAIDGIAHTYLADIKTAKIDKVNRNKLNCTTEDGDEYVQSGVNEFIDEDLEFSDGVRNLAGKTSYDLYFDRYGYLAAFVLTDINGNFTLLTNGWFMAQRGGNEYAVMAYIDGKQVDTTVNEGGSLFIDSKDVQNNGWGALKYFGGAGKALNGEGRYTKTTVASLNEDGTLTPVDRSATRRTVRMLATEENIIPKSAYVAANAYSTTTGSDIAYDAVQMNTAKTAPAEVEVRALSNTVYYYVYPNSNDATRPTVRVFEGYNKLPALAKGDEKLIEDVYVVGTQNSRQNDLGDKTYYTANVVVVEFKEGYRSNAEQVFVYDLPEVHSSVRIEGVQMIRENGADETVDIDLTASELGEYDPAWGKRVQPGLYYMYETNTEGLYTLSVMSRADIADNNYTVGQVITTRGTGDYDYTEIKAFNYAGPTDFNNTATGATPEYRIGENSKLYSLSYNGNVYDDSTKSYYYEADLKSGDKDTVLAERVDATNDAAKDPSREADVVEKNHTVYYNYNDVLVHYDRNGNLVYAISFANLTRSDAQNYAQYVWNSVKPDPKVVGAPVVTFYGEKDNLGNDLDSTVETIEVSWTTANKFNGKNVLEIEGAKEWVLKQGSTKITDKDIKINADTTQTYDLLIIGENGNAYNYTLVQDKKSSDAKLINADGSTTAITTDYTKYVVAQPVADPAANGKIKLPTEDGTDVQDTRISDWLKGMKLVGIEAEVEWVIEFNNGKETATFTGMVPDSSVGVATVTTISNVNAIVTAEDDTEYRYVLVGLDLSGGSVVETPAAQRNTWARNAKDSLKSSLENLAKAKGMTQAEFNAKSLEEVLAAINDSAVTKAVNDELDKINAIKNGTGTLPAAPDYTNADALPTVTTATYKAKAQNTLKASLKTLAMAKGMTEDDFDAASLDEVLTEIGDKELESAVKAESAKIEQKNDVTSDTPAYTVESNEELKTTIDEATKTAQEEAADKSASASADSRYGSIYRAAGMTITADNDAKTVSLVVDSITLQDWIKNKSSDTQFNKLVGDENLDNNVSGSGLSANKILFAGVEFAAPTGANGVKVIGLRNPSAEQIAEAERTVRTSGSNVTAAAFVNGALHQYIGVATWCKNELGEGETPRDVMEVLNDGTDDFVKVIQFYTDADCTAGNEIGSVQVWTITRTMG